jgi:pullulanase/glycogen debranching enzyme
LPLGAESSWLTTYYRHNLDGSYSDAAACGNEAASERTMVHKLTVESVAYWAREYHVDGFRFDLVGVLDLRIMLAVRVALDEIDPSLFMYGEGWTAGPSSLPQAERAVKANVGKLDRVAAFGDELRDGVKASCITLQGVAFLPVSDEFLRTKGGSHNSYNLPDSVNLEQFR